MSDELSEERARALLARAAATIEVDSPQPQPQPHRRRGAGLLVGAAAAVLLIVGLVVLVGRAGDGPTAPDGRPVEQEHRYGDDRMPALLGADRDAAVAELEDRGLQVRVSERSRGCWPADVVTRTVPAAGQPVAAGAEVRVQVTVPRDVVDCVGEPDNFRALGLLRFARGWADVPRLAPRVELSLDGGPAVTVDAADLRDPESPAWTLCTDGTCHAAPALLRDLGTRTPVDLGPGARLPGIRAGHGSIACGNQDHGAFVTVDRGATGDVCPQEAVWWVLDEDGRIAEIGLTTLPPDPQVAPDRVRTAAADRFVAWARGTGPAPAFAERVRSMLAGQDYFGAPRWNDRPDDRGSWAGCSGLGFPDCGLDPVATILHFAGDVAVASGRADCPAGRSPVPPRYAAASDDIVRLSPRGARCEGWRVELWIDARGQVYGVNLS